MTDFKSIYHNGTMNNRCWQIFASLTPPPPTLQASLPHPLLFQEMQNVSFGMIPYTEIYHLYTISHWELHRGISNLQYPSLNLIFTFKMILDGKLAHSIKTPSICMYLNPFKCNLFYQINQVFYIEKCYTVC